MIRLMISLLGIGFMMSCLSQVEAQPVAGLPLEVRVIDETKLLEKIRHREDGRRSDEKKMENSYTAELRFPPIEGSIEGIKLRLISFFRPYNWQQQKVTHMPGKIQVRENISLLAGETKRIEFDPEQFKELEGRSDTTGGVVHYGQEYFGVVLEIYHNGSLVGQRFDGSPDLRQIYEAWLERLKKPAPANKNSGPVLNQPGSEPGPQN